MQTFRYQLSYISIQEETTNSVDSTGNLQQRKCLFKIQPSFALRKHQAQRRVDGLCQIIFSSVMTVIRK